MTEPGTPRDAGAPWAPLILTVAPNGAHKSKHAHPDLPITPTEIARTAAECAAAGAAMIHLHVRDAEGQHSLDVDLYRAAIDAVKHAVGDDLIIQVTSEAGGKYRPPQQMDTIRALRPESASLAIREIVPDAASEPAAAEFLQWVVSENVIPQFILYSAEDVERYRDLRLRAIVPPGPHPVLFVLGRYSANQTSDPNDLLPFLNVWNDDGPWSVCAFGPREHACGIAAAALGGHVRVGFENNLYLKDGTLATNNAALVTQLSDAANALGRPLADADTARKMLRLS